MRRVVDASTLIDAQEKVAAPIDPILTNEVPVSCYRRTTLFHAHGRGTRRPQSQADVGFIHFYNHHRNHGALNWATPATTLNHLHNQDNVPVMHS